MSGNAFKNDYHVSRIDYQAYKALKSKIINLFPEVEELGSGQRFKSNHYWECDNSIGDLDLAVKMSKPRVLEEISKNTLFKDFKVFGNTISTIISLNDKYYHVDLMPSENPVNESWIMTGGSPQIKGVMRNILLSFLARQISKKYSTEKTTLKFTIAYPGGIGCSINGQKIKERSTLPKDILSTLDLDHESWDIVITKTFEGLCDYVEWTQDLYEEFTEYARSQWLYKKDPKVIEIALEFLKTNYIDFL